MAGTGAGPSLSWGQHMIEATTVYAKLKGHVTGSLGTMRVLSNGLGPEGEMAFKREIQDFCLGCQGRRRSTRSMYICNESHTEGPPPFSLRCGDRNFPIQQLFVVGGMGVDGRAI